MLGKTVPETTGKETAEPPPRAGDTLGSARVSTGDQNPDAQRTRLVDAIRVFTDVASGKQFDRPGLAELVEHARPGDRLCVTRLDRLGRSLRDLLETVDSLKARAFTWSASRSASTPPPPPASSCSTSSVPSRTSSGD